MGVGVQRELPLDEDKEQERGGEGRRCVVGFGQFLSSRVYAVNLHVGPPKPSGMFSLCITNALVLGQSFEERLKGVKLLPVWHWVRAETAQGLGCKEAVMSGYTTHIKRGGGNAPRYQRCCSPSGGGWWADRLLSAHP